MTKMSPTMIPCKRCLYFRALDKSCRANPKGVGFIAIPQGNPMSGQMTMNITAASAFPDCSGATDGCYSGVAVTDETAEA